MTVYPRVLAVDDNQTNLLLLEKILAKVNIVPDKAKNGLEALKLIREKSYDLILLDVLMPLIDGIETVRLIQATHPEPPPCIALVTAADPEACQLMLNEKSVTALIRKGSSYSSFKQSILDLLQNLPVRTA